MTTDQMPPLDVYSEEAYEAAALLRDLDSVLAFQPRDDEAGEVAALRSDFLYRVRDFVASQLSVIEACIVGNGMPPLPHRGHDAADWGGRSTGPFLFERDEVIAYAQQHAAQQVAAERERAAGLVAEAQRMYDAYSGEAWESVDTAHDALGTALTTYGDKP